MDFHEFEHAGWQRAAARYAGTYGTLTALAVEPLLDAARVGSGTRVLDVATGPGYVAAAAARRGARATGIDFSDAMIADARRAHPELEFRAGDAEALAEPDASYDAVVMSFGLLHLARPEAAIAEAHRVLAPRGRFAFTVWSPASVGFTLVLDAVDRHGTRDVGLPEGPPFFRYGDPGEARRALAAFAETDALTIPLSWRLTSPDDLFVASLYGGVRTSALLRAQTPEALAAIERDVRTAVEKLGCELPMPIVLATASKA